MRLFFARKESRPGPAVERQQPRSFSDLTVDRVAVLENKAEAVRSYEQYIRDAEKENAAAGVEVLERIAADELRHVDELKERVATPIGGLARGAQDPKSAQDSQQTER